MQVLHQEKNLDPSRELAMFAHGGVSMIMLHVFTNIFVQNFRTWHTKLPDYAHAPGSGLYLKMIESFESSINDALPSKDLLGGDEQYHIFTKGASRISVEIIEFFDAFRLDMQKSMPHASIDSLMVVQSASWTDFSKRYQEAIDQFSRNLDGKYPLTENFWRGLIMRAQAIYIDSAKMFWLEPERIAELSGSRSCEYDYEPSDSVVDGFIDAISLFQQEIQNFKNQNGPLQSPFEWLHPQTISAWEQFLGPHGYTLPEEHKSHAKIFICKQLKDLLSLWADAVRGSEGTATFRLTNKTIFRPAVRTGIERWIPMSEEKISLFLLELRHSLVRLANGGQYGCDWFTLKLDHADIVLSVSPLPWKSTRKTPRKDVVLD